MKLFSVRIWKAVIPGNCKLQTDNQIVLNNKLMERIDKDGIKSHLRDNNMEDRRQKVEKNRSAGRYILTRICRQKRKRSLRIDSKEKQASHLGKRAPRNRYRKKIDVFEGNTRSLGRKSNSYNTFCIKRTKKKEPLSRKIDRGVK